MTPSAPRCALLAFATLLVLLSPRAGHAGRGDGWVDLPPFEASPGDLIEAADAEGTEGDVVLLLQDIGYSWDAAGRATSTLHQVYVVRTKAALEGWGLTEARWSPWHQARPEIRARVLSPDGQEHWLDPASFAEAAVAQSDPTLFDDDRLLRAPLPGMTVGALVEEQIVYRDEEPFFPGGGVTRITVGELVPVERMRIRLEAPAAMALTWRAVDTEPEVRRGRARGVQRLELELLDLPPLTGLEDFVPPDHSPLPYIEFSTARSWGDVAGEYRGQLEDAMVADAVQPLVAEARGEPEDRRALVARALAALRSRVRYTGVEFGRQSIVPYATSETLARGYGDCKDQAVLLVTILRELGLEADVALLRAGPGPDIGADMPGLELFNHAIVHVGGDPVLWIDPTAPYSALGELPLSDQGRLALLARTDTEELVPTPLAPSSANLYREVREIVVPHEGAARVTELTTATGWIGASLRYNYTDSDKETVASYLGQYADEMYSAQELTSWTLAGVDDASQPFSIDLQLDGVLTAYASGADATVLVNPLVAMGWIPQPLTLLPHEGGGPVDGREHPLAIPRHRAEIVYRIQVADGYQARLLPSSRERTFGPLLLAESYQQLEDGTVEVSLIVDTGDGVLTPAEAEKLRQEIADIQYRSPLSVAYDQAGELHLAHGRIGEAITTYDALIQAHPDVGLYRSLRGAAMLPASFGEAAREEAQRAVEVDPDSPSAWRYLGYVLMHDVYGRELEWPFDRDGAIDALERTLELEPLDAVAMQNLAVVVEYDDDGHRYGAGADLARAAELYRQRKHQFDARDLDLNLMFVLFHTDRHAELQALAREVPSSLARDALLFASISLSDSPQRVVVEANQQAMSGVTKQAEVEEAARMLIQSRHYPEAAELLRAAAKDSVNPVALRQQASRIDPIRPYEEVLDGATGPEGVVLRMIEALFRPGTDPAGFRELFSDEMVDDEEGDAPILDALTEMSAMLRQQNLSPEVVLDLGFSALSFDVEGDDRLGYRIRGRSQDGQAMDSMFVVRERGEYRIRASWTAPSSVGDEALARVARGDLEGARQWLRWAAEEMGPPQTGTGDPLGPSPFQQLWDGDAEMDRNRLRLVAATLAAPISGAKTAPILERARRSTEDEDERVQIDRALVVSYASMDEHERSLEAALRLADAVPDHTIPLRRQVHALSELGRMDEAMAVAEGLAAASPGDPRAAVTVAGVAQDMGDPERAIAALRDLDEAGRAEPWMLNQLAWYLVFVDPQGEMSVEYATRSNMERSEPDPAALHTLAVALAEQGRTHEAREILVLALAQLDSADDLPPIWWHVIGRMAEEYDLRHVAIDAYRRVPEIDKPLSTFELTARRLSGLGAP